MKTHGKREQEKKIRERKKKMRKKERRSERKKKDEREREGKNRERCRALVSPYTQDKSNHNAPENHGVDLKKVVAVVPESVDEKVHHCIHTQK